MSRIRRTHSHFILDALLIICFFVAYYSLTCYSSLCIASERADREKDFQYAVSKTPIVDTGSLYWQIYANCEPGGYFKSYRLFVGYSSSDLIVKCIVVTFGSVEEQLKIHFPDPSLSAFVGPKSDIKIYESLQRGTLAAGGRVTLNIPKPTDESWKLFYSVLQEIHDDQTANPSKRRAIAVSLVANKTDWIIHSSRGDSTEGYLASPFLARKYRLQACESRCSMNPRINEELYKKLTELDTLPDQTLIGFGEKGMAFKTKPTGALKAIFISIGAESETLKEETVDLSGKSKPNHWAQLALDCRDDQWNYELATAFGVCSKACWLPNHFNVDPRLWLPFVNSSSTAQSDQTTGSEL